MPLFLFQCEDRQDGEGDVYLSGLVAIDYALSTPLSPFRPEAQQDGEEDAYLSTILFTELQENGSLPSLPYGAKGTYLDWALAVDDTPTI